MTVSLIQVFSQVASRRKGARPLFHCGEDTNNFRHRSGLCYMSLVLLLQEPPALFSSFLHCVPSLQSPCPSLYPNLRTFALRRHASTLLHSFKQKNTAERVHIVVAPVKISSDTASPARRFFFFSSYNMARFISMAQSALGRLGGPSYTPLPAVEGPASPRLSEKTTAAQSTAEDTDAATRLKVLASVSFYLVAALVVRVTFSPP